MTGISADKKVAEIRMHQIIFGRRHSEWVPRRPRLERVSVPKLLAELPSTVPCPCAVPLVPRSSPGSGDEKTLFHSDPL